MVTDWDEQAAIPIYRTLNWLSYNASRKQRGSLTVNIAYRGSKEPLHLPIDGTGVKVEGEGEWHTRKYGGSKRRIWRQLHIGIDERTLEIRAVEITGNDVGDAPVLPILLAQIPQDEEIGSVAATRPSQNKVPMRSFHPGGLQSRGARQRLVPGPEMRPYGLQNASDGRSGDAGAGITAEAASRRKYTASNCSASAAWHETLTVRSSNFTSASPYSIASPRSESQSHRPFGKQRPIKKLAASDSRFVQQSPSTQCG